MRPLVLPHQGHHPKIHPTAFLAPGAVVTGDVEVGEYAGIWFYAVVRGDVSKITIGRNTNVQDGSVLHGQLNEHDVRVGDNVTIGHQAIVHGCVVEDDVLIGMGARVLNGSVIGCGSIVAAGAVVLEGTKIPEGSLVAGVPASVRRKLSPNDREKIQTTAEHYIEYAKSYHDLIEKVRADP